VVQNDEQAERVVDDIDGVAEGTGYSSAESGGTHQCFESKGYLSGDSYFCFDFVKQSPLVPQK